MRPLVLLLLALSPLLLGACTAPPASAPPGTGFDGRAWLAEARALNAPLDSLDYDDEARTGRMKALSRRLAAEADWPRACDTYTDYETGEVHYDPIPEGQGHGVRGTLQVAEADGPAGTLVAITCDFGAYQGSYALVQVTDGDAALLEAPVLDEAYRPTARRTARYSTPLLDAQPAGTFATRALYRGPGDCGEWVRYRVTGPGTAEVVEVRAQDCDYDGEPTLDAWTWPVVYPR